MELYTTNIPQKSTSAINPVLEVIHSRKSIRHFTGEQISREIVEQLLRAGMAAPTAMHMMPWEYVVVTDAQLLRQLQEALPFAKMLVNAGTAIIVCAEPGRAALGKEAFAIMDCTCASENILLAARALHLGAVWTAVYPDAQLMTLVRQILQIPETTLPLNVIPVGIPMAEEAAADKFNAKCIHWEKW